MVRRLLALGAAVALCLSLAITSFAIQFPFPYFTAVSFSQGSDYLITRTEKDSEHLILGSYSSSFSNSGSGSIQFRLYLDSVDESLYDCSVVNGGTYSIDGYFDFSSSSEVNGAAFGNPRIIVSPNSGSNAICDVDVLSYEYIVVNGTSNKRIHYSIVFNVPNTIDDVDNIGFLIPVTGSYSCIGWSVYTGAPDYLYSDHPINPDQNSIDQGFRESLLGRLFNYLGAGFTRIVDAVKDDSDAQQAAQIADQQSIETGQSQITAVESFEASTSQSISSGVSTINNSGYLTVPDYTSSYSGMGAALAAIGLIFAGVFNCLGGYQVVVTVPLVLGIMLILIGRGTLALGRIVSANARVARRHEGGDRS